jgi:hypothetical protein
VSGVISARQYGKRGSFAVAVCAPRGRSGCAPAAHEPRNWTVAGLRSESVCLTVTVPRIAARRSTPASPSQFDALGVKAVMAFEMLALGCTRAAPSRPSPGPQATARRQGARAARRCVQHMGSVGRAPVTLANLGDAPRESRQRLARSIGALPRATTSHSRDHRHAQSQTPHTAGRRGRGGVLRQAAIRGTVTVRHTLSLRKAATVQFRGLCGAGAHLPARAARDVRPELFRPFRGVGLGRRS